MTLSHSSQMPYSPLPPTTKFLFCSLRAYILQHRNSLYTKAVYPLHDLRAIPASVLPPGFLMIRTWRAAWKESIHLGEKTCTGRHSLLLVLSTTYGNYHCVPGSVQALSIDLHLLLIGALDIVIIIPNFSLRALKLSLSK